MRYDVDLYFEKNDECVFIESIQTSDLTIATFAFHHLFKFQREMANDLDKKLTLQLIMIEKDGTDHLIKIRVCDVSS